MERKSKNNFIITKEKNGKSQTVLLPTILVDCLAWLLTNAKNINEEWIDKIDPSIKYHIVRV